MEAPVKVVVVVVVVFALSLDLDPPRIDLTTLGVEPLLAVVDVDDGDSGACEDDDEEEFAVPEAMPGDAFCADEEFDGATEADKDVADDEDIIGPKVKGVSLIPSLNFDEYVGDDDDDDGDDDDGNDECGNVDNG